MKQRGKCEKSGDETEAYNSKKKKKKKKRLLDRQIKNMENDSQFQKNKFFLSATNTSPKGFLAVSARSTNDYFFLFIAGTFPKQSFTLFCSKYFPRKAIFS